MLEIEYKGGNAVKISTKNVVLTVDPKRSVFGLADIEDKAAVHMATEPLLMVDSETDRIKIDGPGEYETADISITGIDAIRHIDTDEKKATIYRIATTELRVALLGNIQEKLTETQLESLGVIDILILPVGGNGYTLDATAAAAITRLIDPKVVVPVSYADDGLQYEVPQESVDVFLKELGATIGEATSKLKYKSFASLPDALTAIVVNRTA